MNNYEDDKTVMVIGAGLAGCECALTLANMGICVELVDMKKHKKSPAHKMDTFAELVCSNSLKNMDSLTAAGLFKYELEKMGSNLLKIAKMCSVGAGAALAVDREKFSLMVTKQIEDNKNIKIIDKEITEIPEDKLCVVCTGPLTSDALSAYIKSMLHDEGLYFYDASAPIVSADSIDYSRAVFMNRYGKGEPDYLNLDLNKQEYDEFYEQLVSAQTVELKQFEQIKVFEGCMPIEILAKRGKDAIRFGPMKPVGIKDNNGNTPYAVVQLRKEDEMQSAYNLVGFQTNLRFPEQKRVFALIPALKNAEFLRYGVMHRNTYINSPKNLNADLSLKANDKIYFAGQIAGTEGYVEAIAGGLFVAHQIARRLNNQSMLKLSNNTVTGALFNYVTSTNTKFEPMSANYGLLSPLDIQVKDKDLKKQMLFERSINEIEQIKF